MFIIYTLLALVPLTSGRLQLLDDLLKNDIYDKRDIPLVDGGDSPLVVKITIALREIVQLNAKSQLMTTSMWIRLQWNDTGLTWDPDKYNGTKHVTIPHDELWIPDIMLYDNTDTQYRQMVQHVNAVAWYNGEVIFTYPTLFKTTCLFNIYYFPFDEQECQMKLGSWTYDIKSLRLELDYHEDHGPINELFYKNNSEWDLVGTNATIEQYFELECCDELIDDLTFKVLVRRKAIMQVYYLYFPNALINVVATFQFLLPCDSAEKITLGITIQLAMIVYILLMAEILPMTDVVPNIVVYMTITLTLVTISLVITIIVLQIHHNGRHDNRSTLPSWARVWFLHRLAKVLCMHRYITSDDEHIEKLTATTSKVTVIDDEEEEGGTDDVNQVNNATSISTSKVPHVGSDAAKQRKSLESSKFKLGGKGSYMFRRNELEKNKETILLKILRHCEEFSERAVNEDKEAELASEWQQLAMVLDRFFFWIYVAVNLAVWIVIFSSKPTYKSYYKDPRYE